jgi:four helix bundle protein
MGDYRKLDVYQKACVFSGRIAVITGRLPHRLREKADQLRRASDSIHETIAEGCGLDTDPQLLKYLKIALGSANECEDELHTLNRRHLLLEDEKELLDEARRIRAMLAKFIIRVEGELGRAGRGRGRQSRERSAAAVSK